MKRQRGRGRKSGNPANRSYQSNCPGEVKINGNASQIYDKYLQLARDASSAGDRVRAENLYQHAEHYYRIVQANQPKRDPNQDDGDNHDGMDDDDTLDASDDNNTQGNGDGRDRRDNRSNREDRDGRDGRDRRDGREGRRGRGRNRQQSSNEDPLGVVTPEGDAPAADAKADTGSDAPKPDASEEDNAPRRTRRPRRTKAEIAADKAAAEAALENAGASSGDKDGSDSEAA
jgi:hypothetical protein